MNTRDFEKLDMLEARDLIRSRSSVYILISEKYKSRIKACCKRVDRLERLLRKRTRMKMAWYYIYMLYVSITNTLLTLNHDKLDHALNVYMVSWGYIKRIHGEPIENQLYKVTFSGRT